MSAQHAAAAWTRWLERLGELGTEVLGAPHPAEGDQVLDNLEHLADQVVAWTSWEVLHADPTRPFFQRHNDLVTQWGGPNADNVYRHARIDARHRYRIRGRMHGCDEFLMALRAGFMHRDTWGTLATVTASERGIGRGDEFELLLGGDDPDAIPIPEGAIMASFREYYLDWRAEEPAVITIECLDPEGPASADAALTDATLARRIDEAAAEITESVQRWNDYMIEHRAERVDNSFDKQAHTVAKGLPMARYEFCFWDLAPDQALVIEADIPAARYWSAQLYMSGTFELVDPYGHITSRNHNQTVVSSDSRVRWVLSHRDPGVANWLDAAGRRNGLLTLRWFWPTGEAGMTPTTQVVALEDVAGTLPPDTISVSAEERAAELASRQDHLRWRFRT
ncbi:MAG: DUF1214 domain-containing protein [Acidimicrobiales bacterium]|nr:DUF1214 domain-containing protein [Acidimicrobiales bacterium]